MNCLDDDVDRMDEDADGMGERADDVDGNVADVGDVGGDAMLPADQQAPGSFTALGPDEVLSALEAVGVRCDGRLQALNSFENRVYLVGLEDGGSCVAKFYRPGRWHNR